MTFFSIVKQIAFEMIKNISMVSVVWTGTIHVIFITNVFDCPAILKVNTHIGTIGHQSKNKKSATDREDLLNCPLSKSLFNEKDSVPVPPSSSTVAVGHSWQIEQ